MVVIILTVVLRFLTEWIIDHFQIRERIREHYPKKKHRMTKGLNFLAWFISWLAALLLAILILLLLPDVTEGTVDFFLDWF